MDLELNPKQTALVLIDLEHGIVGRDLAPYKGTEVVERCAQLADAVRKAGGTVVYVHVLLHEIPVLPADKPSVAPGAPPPPASASELVPEAGVTAQDVIVVKRQRGAFYGTDLDLQLRRRAITTIIMGGIATNIGVESTARVAFDMGYQLVFAEDAMSTMSTEMQEFAVKQIFPTMGRVRSSAEIIKAIG